MTAAAQERGLLGLPQPGAIVEIAWAYGRPHKPYVRGVLPERQSLPDCDADWQTWQQRNGCFQQVDDAGNWKRHTDGEINDDCRTSVLKTQERLLELVNELKTVAEHSTEDVEGVKRIEAGALKLLSAGHANLGAADNINLTGGADINLTTGRNCRSVAKGSHHLEGTKVWLGDSANNVLAILGEFMTVTANALTELAGHTHGSDGLPNVKGSVEQKATEIQTSKTAKLDPMTK